MTKQHLELTEQHLELPNRFADADALWNWLDRRLDLQVARRPVCPDHQAPFDYLCHAYFEPTSDVVVWAPRGGGKTRLGAVATLLDLMHKAPLSVRILGGSLDQSLKMWDHLLPDAQAIFGDTLSSKAMRLRTAEGASAAVLTQSERAVRGLRVQKLRCDEVELFYEHIWTAAQLVTRSIQAQAFADVRGVIEVFSTLHQPFGLMQRIIEQAEQRGTRVIKWCLLEVLERCPAERSCDGCPLWDACRGVAKTRCEGHVRIDDAIAMKQRVSQEVWETEILCRRPRRDRCVFNHFDPQRHVRQTSSATEAPPEQRQLTLAIDFGYSAPFVCLWVVSDGVTVHVVDEYLQPQRTVMEHIEHIAHRPWGKAGAVACDPAGSRRDEQTARSNVALLREAGYTVRTRQSYIADGLEMIRAGLRPASGPPRLFFHPRCRKLIAAMQQYHYAPRGSELPLKDGVHDHPIDALRYFYVNRGPSIVRGDRRY